MKEAYLLRLFLFLTVASAWALPVFCYAAEGVAGLSPAVVTTLAQSKGWKALLHYPKDQEKSLIDDPGFFLAPTGATDPHAELIATLHAFADPDQTPDSAPACRYMARYVWLQSQLAQLVPSPTSPTAKPLFATPQCPKWEALKNRIKPRKATLVFPDGHLNSPASMFGHTLLRIDQEGGNALLSYAINYAAQTNEDNGFAYAFNGIFGYYKGLYSLLPYTEKLREYRHSEQRDIWEYALSLSPAEVEQLLAHAWELQDTYAYYYFFNKNCSYQLLALIEAVRPELDLLSGLGVSVIPIDTVRQLREQQLIGGVKYRPSHVSMIKHLETQLSRDELGMVQNLASADVPVGSVALPDNPANRLAVLDTAVEYLQYKQAREDIDLAQYRPRYLTVLKERSKLGAANASTPLWQEDVIQNQEPSTGHGTKKWGVYQQWQDGQASVKLQYRTAYHELTDRPAGYLQGAGIAFFDTMLNWRPSEQKASIEKFSLVQIQSLSPRTPLLPSLSWRVNFGFDRSEALNANSPLRLNLNLGAGHAYAWADPSVLLFGTLEAKLSTKKYLKGMFADAGWRVGAQWQANEQWAFTLIANDWFGLSDASHRDKLLQLDAAWYINPNLAAHTYYKTTWRRANDTPKPIIGVNVDWFF